MPANINLSSRLLKQLSTELEVFLHTIGETAARQGQNIYLVGGAVRDLLLGLSPIDIDLVVEGNAIALAKSIPLSRMKITVHQAFGTANIKWNHISIDLATARSEIYSQPGVLPEVTPSNINRDLFRRDFSINAMAISLHRDSFGELIDPYRGMSDVKNRCIRVLHEKSFVDDATRIWRAIRYEQRLKFKIETGTLQLLKRDINMLDTISGDRIRHEIEIILKEKEPEKVFCRADELRVLAKLSPALTGVEWLKEKYSEARVMGLSDVSLVTVYLGLLVYSLNTNELAAIVAYLRLKRTMTQVLKNTIDLKGKICALNTPSLPNSEVYFVLDGYLELAVITNLIATDITAIEKHIENYLTKLRHVKLRLNGNDLKRMGVPQGPDINRLLHLLHAAKLNGKVITKQGETRLVYNWLREREAKKKQ
ncbi:MAG: CCA tRNA nucleotidyltransferase [Dehalococcoidales bacterium]|nr:CCA tRNA nucleotidyltransferase [Dehalococcoidales bacterium]